MDFSGRVALVTGAGNGLGRVYALWLAKHGAKVIVNNRSHADRPSSACAVAQEIIADGGMAIADENAVESVEGCNRIIANGLAAFGRIDICICNAGITQYKPFAELTMDEFHEMIDVNLWGTVYLIHGLWPKMLSQKYGRIVLTTSTTGIYGLPTSSHYAAAKASMLGFARSLSQEVPDDADVKVNLIAPAARTKMAAEIIHERFSEILAPEKVGPVVGYLASESCDISGAVLSAGGGRVRRVRITEGAPVQISGDEFEIDWDTLNRMDRLSEHKTVFEAVGVMVPELAG